MSQYPAIGSPAPDFNAPVVGNDCGPDAILSPSALKGQPVVLYFYPKDDTPGCTVQACSMRDGWARIADKAKVFGISIDSARRHQNFIKKYGLPFPLIVDENHHIAEAYGVWVEKTLYGRKYMGTERTTFIIAADGTLKAVLSKVKPDEHLERVLAEL